jgi:hypothetical protein
MNRPVAISALLAALLMAGSGLGCSREPDLPDRYARKFLPFVAGWRLESEIPAKIQESPHMVIWEVSEFPPETKATPAQRRAADDLVERCRAAAVAHGWHDYDRGLADGYHLPRDSQGGVLDARHYRNDAFVLDNATLDPERPEYLMYYPTPDGTQQLVGFMFFGRQQAARGPQIGGPLTVWHYHIFKTKQCLTEGILQGGWAVDGKCEKGVGYHRSAEMLHVWLIDRPLGAFSTSMWLKNPMGLDARFVPPEGDDFELFSAHLQAGLWALDEEDSRRVTEALLFLTFDLNAQLKQSNPELEDTDLFEPARVGLLRLTQQQGASMTMRRYLGLAAELRARKPELWAEFLEDP